MGSSTSSEPFDYDAELLSQKKARASWPKPSKKSKEKDEKKSDDKGEKEEGEKAADGADGDKEKKVESTEKEEKTTMTPDKAVCSPIYRARGGYKKRKDGTLKPSKLLSSYVLDEEELKELAKNENIEVPAEIKTLNDMLNYAAAKFGDKNFYGTRYRNDDGTVGDYVWMSYAAFRENARNLARGLEEECNVKKNDNVGIFGVNRVEWCMTSWANMTRGYRSVALYDTLGAVAIEHILGHAELSVVACEKKQISKLLEVKKKCGDDIPLKYIIQFDEREGVNNKSDALDEDDKKACKELGIQLLAMTDVINTGAKHEADLPDDPPTADDLAFIMYTSGTTGVPKGVMLTHQNLISTAVAAEDLFKIQPTDRHLSYLTLAHIYESVVHLGYMRGGAAIYFFNGDIRKLIDDFPACNPTVLCGVPRVYQRIYDRVMGQVSQAPLIKRFFFKRFLKKSSVSIRRGARDKSADTKVWIPLRERLGLKDVRICVTGAAPMAPYLSEFLKVALGSVVLQGYGLTETAAATTISTMDDLTVGHVGPPLSCVEIKLVEVPEMGYSPIITKDNPNPKGEVWVRGPNVFQGYYKMEDKTKEVFPEGDGFFATGDIGRFNPNGTLSIIDRKKNIFKLSQGEYVASERVENLYAKSEAVGQIWVYGNSFKPFLLAVLVPSFDFILKHAKAKGWWPKDSDLLPGKPEFSEKFAELFSNSQNAAILKDLIVQDMRSKESSLKGFEKVRDIIIEAELDDLGQGFSVDNNCMTPSFKLKRPQLKDRYKKQLIETYEKHGEKGEDGF